MRKYLDLIKLGKEYEKIKPLKSIIGTDFVDIIKNCQPFVIHVPQERTIVGKSDEFRDCIDKELDAPFKIFSLELFGTMSFISEADEFKVCLPCIVCIESEPKKYDFIASMRTEAGTVVWVIPYKHPKYEIMHGICRSMLLRINNGQLGLEKTREKIKLKHSGKSIFHKISKIIHVRPKQKKQEQNEIHENRHIDWTHRFSVRGHWRYIPGRLGKDREGNYCIEGATWVVDHIRGQDDLPFINKTRIINNNILENCKAV